MKIHKYYRRHETVDPQGKNFDNKKRPSKGYIMWKMMGGDAGHSWSKSLEDKAKAEPCWAGYEMVGTKYQGGKKVPNCVPIEKAEYQGRKVELNKPRRLSGDKKKFGVYVKNDKGNVVQVKFGDPNMDIKRDDPDKRRQFRARHNCDNPGPKHKARYWSCKMWSTKNVSDITKAECPCTIKTERLQKTNNYLDDVMRMIKFGAFIQKKPEDEKKPKKKPRSGTQPSGTWMANCKYNARKLSVSDKGNPFTGGRKVIRNEGAWCAELWRNPGKYDQQYKKPDGTIHTSVRVQIAYGPVEKFLARLEQKPDLRQRVAITLPRLAFEMTNIQYDNERKVSTMQTFKARTTGSAKTAKKS